MTMLRSHLAVYLYTISLEAVSSKAQSNLEYDGNDDDDNNDDDYNNDDDDNDDD